MEKTATAIQTSARRVRLPSVSAKSLRVGACWPAFPVEPTGTAEGFLSKNLTTQQIIPCFHIMPVKTSIQKAPCT
jgi:hypothetical protein